MDMTLDRVRAVWEGMGGGDIGYTVIVAGTNGKGSTISMMEAVLVEAGNRTGTYTSPHLVRFNERIKINARETSDDEICMAFCAIESSRKRISLTYFEYATLCALYIFRENQVEVCLLEVGMGGRLDATNMIDGDLAVITAIGIDHEAWLGPDRESIGAEKAGIIRPGMTVVCSDPDMPESIATACDRHCARLLRIDREFSLVPSTSGYAWQSQHALVPEQWRHIENLLPPFAGNHQLTNLAGAMAALAISSSKLRVRMDRVATALARSRLAARCQVIGSDPLIIVDVAHNRDSASQLALFLDQNQVPGKSIAVFGVLADKSLEGFLQPLQTRIDLWILATLKGERGQLSSDLATKLADLTGNRDAVCTDSPVDAYQQALRRAKKGDRIVIFGSFHTVGDIIGAL